MTTFQTKVKIAIADDHTMFRRGIIKLLDTERYEFLFDVSNGEQLIKKFDVPGNITPDIVIMDLKMPVMNGYMAASWLRERYPDIKILVVSMIEKEETIFRMMKLGIKGYLSKEMEPDDLHEAIQTIMKGNFYYTDIITNKLLHSINNLNNIEVNGHDKHDVNIYWEQLNKGQKEFVRHACTDLTYDEIAQKMFVSPKTIDGYRDAVFGRFNVKNRVGLVLFAIKNGLVSV
ncbi:MAG: response regulator transcription factor [Bacteroidetes bacterium]|nr:response regulator transcription factor [Bacteroidota bacterium]